MFISKILDSEGPSGVTRMSTPLMVSESSTNNFIVVFENLCRQAHDFAARERAVGRHLENQTVIVDALSDTRVLHGVAHLLDGSEDRIHRDEVERILVALVKVRALVASPSSEGDLHVQHRAVVQRRNVQIGVQDFQFRVAGQIARDDAARAHLVDGKSLTERLVLAQALDRQRLDVQHDFRHVFLDARNRREAHA